MTMIVDRIGVDAWRDSDLSQHVQDLAVGLVDRARGSASLTAAQQTLIEGIIELREDLLFSYDEYTRAGIASHVGYLMANFPNQLPSLNTNESLRRGSIPLGNLEMVRGANRQYRELCQIETYPAFVGSACFRARARQRATIARYHGKIAVVTPDIHPADVVLLDTYESRRLTTSD